MSEGKAALSRFVPCVVGFNPPPADERGESRDADRSFADLCVSIRPPLMSEGKGGADLRTVARSLVSIRPPLMSEGKGGDFDHSPVFLSFQSAPR